MESIIPSLFHADFLKSHLEISFNDNKTYIIMQIQFSVPSILLNLQM